MNAILLSRGQPPRTPSLLAFSDYREAEQANGAKHSSVTANGVLLEYETLELRVHPPNVNIDNETYADRTLITLDSANRPGTLVEVVQLLTELGLCVIKARISSDGGWFVDEFSVTDAGKKVTNERKLRAIRKVLSVDADPGSDNESGVDSAFEEASQCSTLFELAGNDRIGLLADVIELLKINGCEVRSAAVWTHNLRCAFVISVLDCSTGLPIKDNIKLARLRQLLLNMMHTPGDVAESVVNVSNTKGLIHYERRLHQLLLREEEAQWRRQTGLAARYEQDIAELHALQERRWAGTHGPGAAGAAGPGPGSAAAGAAASAASGFQRTANIGGRPHPPPLQPFYSTWLPSLPSPGSGGASTGASLGAPPSPKEGSAVSVGSAVAAAAAAANVAVATGSPKVGSPDGSTHGGASASCATSSADAQTGVTGPNGVPISSASEAASGTDASGNNGKANGSAPCTGTTTTGSGSGSLALADVLTPAATLAAPPSPSPPVAPPASSAQKPEVFVQHSKQRDYWMVNIRCRDRQKLLFDTVCTLADLNYDVYHGAVDCELDRDKAGAKVSIAVQTFYMRPRYGDAYWDPRKAAKLKYMLECAIQRRQPQGTKVHIQGAPSSGSGGSGGAPAADLPALTAVWRKFGLCITRAKVRALAGSAGEHTFYLVDNFGRPPAEAVVQQACQQIGGVRLARPDVSGPVQGGTSAPGPAAAMKFAFTVLTRPSWSANQGSPSSSIPDSI
ncbi:hypothetical protein VOLCADRAFT_121048 [Volvox carteri f. nagariensis]|uniref:ACT domain-containing protein n=1 Tax=Volvox carteri f. nagariensis TaxID=3068 RepID=D8U0C9_VOLCA|nr:uncharacterized protein VOLCADRAFT_121048 [Volvox carteri f. nagariensis]EFJ46840.1 hypothetical protein VOLCADRAFT_121048 [Volvox carteri f. nagariensis]|eukprot:XP_002952049.1 hypothetical protein VOLCADRAFT_121048 [Volvox carteri f. nagariensis]